MDSTLLLQTLLVMFPALCHANYPFQDPTLPWDKRVDDLVARLTLEEVAAFSVDNAHSRRPDAERLQIHAYKLNTECLRGVKGTNSTAWPQAVGLAATFR